MPPTRIIARSGIASGAHRRMNAKLVLILATSMFRALTASVSRRLESRTSTASSVTVNVVCLEPSEMILHDLGMIPRIGV